MNSLSGLGVATFHQPIVRPVLCYRSLEDLQTGARPVVRRTDAVWLRTRDGARVNLFACTSQDRQRGSSNAPDSDEPILGVSPLDGASFSISQIGTDIRFDTCHIGIHRYMDSLIEPDDRPPGDTEDVGPGRTKLAFVETEDGIQVATLDFRTGRWSFEATPRSARYQPRGVEVRIFDHLPGRSETTVLELTIIVAAAGVHGSADGPGAPAQEDPEWLLTAHDCALFGSTAPVSDEFASRAARALGTAVPPAKDRVTAYRCLNAFLANLHRDFRSSPTARAFKYRGPVEFPDINFVSWLEDVRSKARDDAGLRTRLGALVDRVARTDPGSPEFRHAVVDVMGSGWAPDVFMFSECSRRGVLRRDDDRGRNQLFAGS